MRSPDYGRYVCRIDIGNAANRLEMAVQIGGPPTEATTLYWSMTLLQLALAASLLLLGVVVLVRYLLAWYRVWRKRTANQCRSDGAGDLCVGSGGGGGRGGLLGACGGGAGCDGATHTVEKLMRFRNAV